MNTLAASTSPPRAGRREILLLLSLSALAAVWLAAWAWGTQPTIGDEGAHWRRAFSYYEAGGRLDHDPLYPPERVGYVGYWDPCLWHLGLARLWGMTGGPSVASAQIYQAVFFFLLAVFAYLAAREVYGPRGAAWAWGLVVSVPATVLFSMVFYLEIPMLALGAMAFYFLLRRWAVPFGAAIGLMCLVKLGSALALGAPLLAVAALRLGDRWPDRLMRFAMAALVAAILVGPEFAWQTEHFGRPLLHGNPKYTTFPQAVAQRVGPVPTPRSAWETHGILEAEAIGLLLGATGPAVLVGAVGLALARAPAVLREAVRRLLGREPDRRPQIIAGMVFGLPILAFLAVFLIFLRHAYNVRYLYPMVLPSALLVAGPLASVRLPWERPRGAAWKRLGAAALALAAAGQFIAAPALVRHRRTLEPAVQEAFDWIAQNTPQDARIFYIEESIYSVTGRPIIWGAVSPRTLFSADAETQALLWLSAGVQYVAVHPTRRMPTSSPDKIPAAYPEDWIATLQDRTYLEKVYDRDGFLLYRIAYDRIPDEWKDLARSPVLTDQRPHPGPKESP
jgi:hypothetical protein